MFKSFTRDIVLAIQAKSGASSAVLAWMIVLALAVMTAFAFLCVAGYVWFTVQFGSIFAGLIMAGIFIVIAAIALLISSIARRRARERAILERTARAHAPSWLLDPRVLSTALQIGRSIGWERIVPVALLGFMAAQWARESRERREQS